MIVELNHIKKEWIHHIEKTIAEKIVIRTKEELADAKKDHDLIKVLIGKADDFKETEFLDLFGSLEMVFILSDGVDGIEAGYFRKRKIVLGHAVGLQEDLISSYVMGAILLYSQGFLACINQKAWIRNFIGNGLCGSNLLIAGYGRIGAKLAGKAAAFGMNIYGICKEVHNVRHGELLKDCVTLDKIDDMLKKADYVVSCLPLTGETYHCFSAETFGKMKREAVFINVSRGGIVDENALLSALRTRQIKGAVLDVFETEPLGCDSPFWTMPNVVVTPHMAGRMQNYLTKCMEKFADNYLQFKENGTIRDKVDFLKGY